MTAKCRGCNKTLIGKDYCHGGDAYDPVTKEKCKVNFYGGFVCSKACDFDSSLQLERSMPGHTNKDTKLGCYSKESLNNNWDHDENR